MANGKLMVIEAISSLGDVLESITEKERGIIAQLVMTYSEKQKRFEANCDNTLKEITAQIGDYVCLEQNARQLTFHLLEIADPSAKSIQGDFVSLPKNDIVFNEIIGARVGDDVELNGNSLWKVISIDKQTYTIVRRGHNDIA